MNREKWNQFWHGFLAWKGWTAWLKWSGWKTIASWKGWHRIFVLPFLPVVLLNVFTACALICIFVTGRESVWIAYPVYVLAFYGLVAFSASLPPFLKRIRAKVDSSPWIKRILSDTELRFQISLYAEQFINFFYGILKTVSGIVGASAWIFADGLYNLLQGIIQLIQILRRKKVLSIAEQWKSYRLCGWLVLILHLTMTGLVFQMIHRNRTEEYPYYLIFATAFFAFYKLITAFVDVARDRKHKAPIDSAVRLLDLSQALFSLFSLQVAMIHHFGGTEAFAGIMNTLTGTAVCLMVVGMGIYMLRRSSREIKKLEGS